MRNLKKILALVLALVMSMSLMATANAFTDDASIDADYEVAAKVLADMGIFQGYPDGSFGPTKAITRQEVAAIMYRIASTDVKDLQKGLYVEGADFTDVKATDWSAGYIGYCANGGIIKGNGDGTFAPAANVTGYQVLAMALRAVGYDANGEFTGADWQKNVATTAQSLGILKNVPGTVQLSQPATRELVAELVFRTLLTKMVEYTPAFGYQPVKVWAGNLGTLGAQQFALKAEAYQDGWGRPGTEYTYNVGAKSTKIMDKAVYTTTVKVDECDIAKALGIASDKKGTIEAAYIDGVNTTVTNATVTTDRTGTIDPLATTSLVGAQGCLTEIYKMPGTLNYRIVEINTYLAKVTKVTPATTDRNGHVVDAKVDLTVYLTDGTGTTFANVKATGYTVGQYVLVNVNLNNPAAVKSIKAATVTPMGQMKSWTPAYGTVAATTTIAATTYSDAVKFFLNNTKVYNNAQNWDVIVDDYGNLIGLVPSTINYLVVEKIEWKHDATAIGNGKALANLVLATGEKVTGATIAKINGATATATYTVGSGYVTGAVVADSYVNNTDYYNHIYTYSVNADGSYNIVKYCPVNNASHNSGEVVFTTGKTSNITNVTGTVVADNNTVFLVKNKAPNDVHSYSVYKGINELPSMTVATGDLCFLNNGYFATLVVINNYTLASNTFVAYADIQNGYATGYTTTTGAALYAYTVYALGSTEPTTVYSTSTNAITIDGFYQVVKAANGIANVTPFMGTYGTGHTAPGTVSGTYATLTWDRGTVKAMNGETVINGETTVHNTYRVNADTKYFTVTKTTWTNGVSTVITASEPTTLAVGDRIAVAYKTTASTEDVAAYIYILKAETFSQATVTTPIDYAAAIKANLEGMTVAAGSAEAAVKAAVTSVVGGSYGEWSYNISGVSFTGIVSQGQPLTVTVTGKVGTTVVTVEGIVRVA